MLNSLIESVQISPLDWEARLVLADAFEDDGDPAQGNVQRQIAHYTKHHSSDAPGGKLLTLIRRAFRYRKRRAVVRISTAVAMCGTYWDEGSKSNYHLFNLESGRVTVSTEYAPPQFGGPSEPPTLKPGRGLAVVETGYFRGRSSTMQIHVHPDDLPLLLDDLAPSAVPQDQKVASV